MASAPPGRVTGGALPRPLGYAVPRILAAQALSSVGTSVSAVAMAVLVFKTTGSVLQMGAVLALSALPVVVMSVVGGVLIDRYSGRILMVLSDCFRGALILLLPVLARSSMAWVYVIAVCIGSLSAVFNPSQIAFLAELTIPERRVRTNAMLTVAREGAELGGYLIGGTLVATLGYVATFSLDAATYALSALILLTLPRLRAEGRVEGEGVLVLARQMPGVFLHIWRRPALKVNLLVALIPMAFLMMATPNAYALALQVFREGPTGLGWMEALTAAGFIVGGAIAGKRDYKGDLNLYVLESLLIMAAGYFLVGISPSFWWAVLFCAVAAVANVGTAVGSMTLFQNIERRPDKGRIISLRMGFGQLGYAIGLLAGGVVGSLIGAQRAFLVIAVGAVVCSAVVYAPYLLRKREHSGEVEHLVEPGSE